MLDQECWTGQKKENNGDVFHVALSIREVGIDLESKELLQRVASTIIDYFDLRVVEEYWHHYTPIGLTGVYVLEQSSLTLHTWSEFRKLVIDITTCGKPVNLDEICADLEPLLETKDIRVTRDIL